MIDRFLQGDSFAVVGASTNREKYGNKVLRAYMQHGKTVYPVNPTAANVEGLVAYPSLSSLPEKVDGVSIIVPPSITLQIVEEAGRLGIPFLWMQPGSESDEAIRLAEELGMETIAGGPCLLVAIGFKEQR